MATETTRQIIQENPEIEAYRLGLLQSVQQFINQNLLEMPPPPITPPAYQVAGLTPMQQQAAQLAQQGIGGYQPYLQQGLGAMRAGEQAARTTGLGGLQEAFGAAREGQAALSQAAQLAAASRAQPFAYQQAAEDVLRGATELGYGAGQAAEEGIGRAIQQGYNIADVTRGDLGRSTQQARNLADVARSDYARAAQQAANVADVTRGDIGRSTRQAYNIAQQARQDLRQAGEYGLQGAERAYGYLGGVGGEFRPEGIQAFMNPYEEQVVQQTMRDIAREGDIQEQQLQAQAAATGAFGGSRQAVAEQELARNVMEQQARTGAQLRMGGYERAGQMAQAAFEQARQRQLAQAQEARNIGQAGANVSLAAAQTGAGLGLQAAGLGQTGAIAAGQQGLTASELASRMAQAGAQTGLQAAGLGQQSAQIAGQQGLQAAGMGLQGAQTAGQLGLQAAGMGQQTAQQLGNLGLQYGQLSQADINQMINIAQAGGQLGQGLGSLAQAGGQLGTQLSQMGLQQAGLGQLGQQLGLQDIKTLEAMGARDQALQQAILDAQRQSNMQLYQMPYQQYSFLSDIYKGTPSSQQVTQISQTQDPSTFQQIAGLGIAGLSAAGGAKQLGMF